MPSFPCAATQPHASLQPGYSGLNPGTEAAQPVIYIFTAAHISFFKSASFRKTNILYFKTFGLFQIGLGGKPTVKAGLERIPSVNILLTLKHRNGQRTVRGIAFKNPAVQNQVRSPAGEAYFMAINRLSPVLDDNVSMGFKYRNHFFPGRYFLTQQDRRRV